MEAEMEEASPPQRLGSLPPIRNTPGTSSSVKTLRRSPSSSAPFQPLLYHEGSSTQLRGSVATPYRPPPTAATYVSTAVTSRAARPSTRGSKVWWSSCRAIEELYDSWTLEDSWHASQRDLQLERLRDMKYTTYQRSLGLGTLFEVNQLKAQRRAAAVQRACDDAALAEIVFLPKLPAAREIAKVRVASPRPRLFGYSSAPGTARAQPPPQPGSTAASALVWSSRSLPPCMRICFCLSRACAPRSLLAPSPSSTLLLHHAVHVGSRTGAALRLRQSRRHL